MPEYATNKADSFGRTHSFRNAIRLRDAHDCDMCVRVYGVQAKKNLCTHRVRIAIEAMRNEWDV